LRHNRIGAEERPAMSAEVGSESDTSAGRACRAVARAQGPWAARPLRERARVVSELGRRLAADADALAASLALVSGRAPAELWSAEIAPTLDALRWLGRRGSAALAPRPLPRSLLQWYFRAARHTLRWEAHGVAGIVTPGNSPLFLAVPQIGAALLGGNGVVWKPAPPATAAALHAAALFYRAGLPPALLQVVPGDAEAARDMVVAGVDKLFFTGGTEAGLALYRLQAERGRPAVLELSGRHVAVVLDDAPVDLAARGIVWAKLANRGRNCVSVQLVLVARPRYEAFLLASRDALAARVASGIGAVPEAEERGRLRALTSEARAAGARVLLGDGSGPTLLADVGPGMRVVEEEVLGPLLAVAGLDAEEQAVRWINGGRHRLSASVWSADAARARSLAERLDVGQVWINDQLHPTAQPEVTLAGRGASGFGASRGLAGLMEMVQPKVISEMPLRARQRHHDPAPAGTEELFRGTVRAAFAPDLRGRARGALELARALRRLART
jgi:acyl-CoA reductase-like NAD-dependent aldehyde dehydrogenase